MAKGAQAESVVAPVQTEAAVADYGKVTVVGFDTDKKELILRVSVNVLDFEKLPASSSGKTRRITNGAMENIGCFRGDAIPAGIEGRNLRLQVGLYADV